MSGAALVLGVLGCAVAARDAIVWSGHQAAAERELRSLERARDDLAGSSGPVDTARSGAIARLADDGSLVAAAVWFGAGSICFGVSVGAALGRVRRRQARAALHPSLGAAVDRKLERVLAEHAQDLVTVLDEHGRFTYVSPSVAAILGHDAATLIGARYDAYLDLPPAPPRARALPRAADGRAGAPPRRGTRTEVGGGWRRSPTASTRTERSAG